MAVAFAAAELLSRRTLGIDLTLLIEGEEEVGSAGFKEAVDAHKALITRFIFCGLHVYLPSFRIYSDKSMRF